MNFAHYLKKQIAESGLSYQQLAERSAVDVAYIHRLASGKAINPGRNVVIRLGIGLGLDVYGVDELLKATGQLPLITALWGCRSR